MKTITNAIQTDFKQWVLISFRLLILFHPPFFFCSKPSKHTDQFSFTLLNCRNIHFAFDIATVSHSEICFQSLGVCVCVHVIFSLEFFFFKFSCVTTFEIVLIEFPIQQQCQWLFRVFNELINYDRRFKNVQNEVLDICFFFFSLELRYL